MNLMKIGVSVIISALILGLGSSPSSASSATAKTWLAQVQQVAYKWKSDAVIVSISTYTGNMDGTADNWSYTFFSAKANKGYNVEVKDDKIAESHEVNPRIKDPVGENFVDSPQAMKVSKKNGLKVKGRPNMTLLVMGQATKTPGPYWTIGGEYAPGEVWIWIDAKTGTIFRHEEIK